MNVNPPTQEEIARRAYEIWETEGNPAGRDVEFWLEAERQLSGRHRSHHAGPASEGHHPPPPNPADLDALAQQQRNEARAPHLPPKPAPKTAPPESAKPLWDKPHSR